MTNIEERFDEFARIAALKPDNKGYHIAKACWLQSAIEQKAIDIDIIPQLYVRWLMIDGEKPSWVEYANKAMGE